MWRPALLALCIAYPRSAPAANVADNAPDNAPAARTADNAPAPTADSSSAPAPDNAPAARTADNSPAPTADSSRAPAPDNAPAARTADNASAPTDDSPSAPAPDNAPAARTADSAPTPESAAARTADHAAVDAPLLGDDTWQYRSSSPVVIDGGLVVGFPAALPTGLATGVGAGITAGKTLLWGARASWATATESSLPWTVTHSDLRLRITGGVQAAPGRGTIGLRLGVGGTLVHETRMRNQGMRAGLTGSELETSEFAMLPAADLDAVIALHIAGPWLLVTSGGPSIDFHDGKLHGGWNAELGVAWQP